MDENRITESSAAEDSLPSEKPAEAQPSQKQLESRLISDYKKEARSEASLYLKEKKAITDPESKKAFRRKWRQRRKEFRSELKKADSSEKKARKKARKIFLHRIHRTRRFWNALIAAVLLFSLIFFGLPSARMLWNTKKSQKFSDSGSEAEIARAAGYLLSEEICEEGIVLLQNRDGFLPLADKKLNVFGDDASVPDVFSRTLVSSLSVKGIDVNKELASFYTESSSASYEKPANTLSRIASRLFPGKTENVWKPVSNSLMRQAKEFSSQALIVLSAEAANEKDCSLSQLQPMKGSSERAKLMDDVCREFTHVILVLRSANPMELGFIADYDSIDAVIWAGGGNVSWSALASVLIGEVNPSGRTVDTWALSLESEPAYNASSSSYYANISDLHLLQYSEGIYMGYRYYETRCGHDKAVYEENVLYPFGYGLSYTDFTEELISLTEENDVLTAEISIRNIGETAGKDVAELYFLPPYTAEKSVEKSVISLAGFAKTALLNPGEEETLRISFSVRDMASWSTAKGAYILDAGDYRIAIGSDVHQALLSESFETYTVKDPVTYSTDSSTGCELQSLLASQDSEEMIVLSRSGWENTFPLAQVRMVASEELRTEKTAYERAGSPYSMLYHTEPVFNADNKLLLSDMRALSFEDEKWTAFLDQFTAEEMIQLVSNGAWHTEAVDRLGIPEARFLGNGDGFESIISSLNAAVYPSPIIVSSTWNCELASKLGSSLAAEASIYGINGWYAPRLSLHRSALGGKNTESFSEDPLLTAKIACAEIKAAQAGGLITFASGFILQDIQLNAGDDLSVIANEQTLRELYLKPYEICVKEADMSGIMTSPVRLGIELCSASDTLLKQLLREEWGFCGLITTDSSLAWINAELSVKNGCSLMFDAGEHSSQVTLQRAYAKDPIGTSWSLRDAVHDICYTLVNCTNLL